jgi:hypothetical protein
MRVGRVRAFVVVALGIRVAMLSLASALLLGCPGGYGTQVT